MRGKTKQPIFACPRGGSLADGTKILDDASGLLLPTPPAALPPSLLLDQAEIVTTAGGRFILMFYASAPGEPPRPAWIQPAHNRDEIDRREAGFATTATLLPPDAAVTTAVRRRLRLLATVSVAEGDFDGIATHLGDPAASLGIFQWATARHSANDDGSSLWRFFHDLRRRSLDAKLPAAERAFYQAAWTACAGAGLDVRGARLLLHGRPVTGAVLERVLQPVFGGPSALRTYQLVAANDWIDRIAATPVPLGRGAANVGELLREDRALATAVLLGVNRPSYVARALSLAAARVGAGDEARLVAEFRRQALLLYPASTREIRAGRLLTSESM